MRFDADENGIQSEIRELINELQSDAERLNVAATKASIPDDLKHMIASIADKIDGVASLIR